MKTTINYNEINNLEFHKTKMEIAWHAANILFGQGYSINILKNGKDDDTLLKKWNQIEKENQFENFLLKMEYNLSYYGNSIATIDRTEKGKIRLGIANPHFYNQVAKINMIDDIAAITYRKIKIDKTQYFIKELWDREKVIRKLYKNNKFNEEIIIDEINATIPEELRIKAIERHNLGVLPLQHFINKQRDINSIMEFNELSDAYTVENQIKVLNTLRSQQLKETMLNTTRVFGNFSQSTIKQMAEKNHNITEMLLRDLFVEIKTGDAQTNKMVEIQQANPQLAIYDEAINNMLRHIWRGAGYTYVQSGDTMSGNAETLYANSQDIRTTKMKRTIRQRDYAELIRKCLLVSKAINENDDIQVIVNIKENVVQSPSQVVDTYLRLNEAGLVSKARVIQKIEQLTTLEQAQAIVDEATKENQEALEKMTNTIANDNDSDIDEKSKEASKYDAREYDKQGEV